MLTIICGNDDSPDEELKNVAKKEEFLILKEIIICIIKEYNEHRKNLKINFSTSELESGIFEDILY